MIEYFLGGVFLTILFIFFIKILGSFYCKRNVVKTKGCKIERYGIEDYWGDEVIVIDRLTDRTICRFKIMKDKKLAYELAELCIRRIGGCENE